MGEDDKMKMEEKMMLISIREEETNAMMRERDEFMSQQEVAKDKIRKREEAMSLQQQQHISSIETFKELLKSMEAELNEKEKELNDMKRNEVETKDRMKLIGIREKESNEMLRQRDTKIGEHLETVNALKNENTRLKDEISDMRTVVDNAPRGMPEEKANNDMKDSTIEELNEKVGRMIEEKMKMESEKAKSIEDLELCKKMAEDKFSSQQEVAKATIQKLEEAISVQKQQHISSTEKSKELLRNMEMKLCARAKELDEIKVKCVQKEAKLNEVSLIIV